MNEGTKIPMQLRKSHLQVTAYLAFIALLLVMPQVMGVFWLNRFCEYLAYALAAIAISVSWGNGGILNLGQAVFFGVGAYMLAMSLTLASPAAQPVPEFMLLNKEPHAPEDLCCVVPGAFVWIPFQNLWFGLMMGLALPVLLALLVGYPMFKRRTTGVYVAIITLALALIVRLLIINNQPLTNGFNGLAELEYFTVFGHVFDPYSPSTYYLAVAVLGISLIGLRLILSSRAGLLLRAIQDDESRARFLGYDVENFKLFFFCLSAAIAGIAGMLFVVVAQFAAPSLMAIPFSISMVIWAAVGGRASLLGAAVGAILVNMAGAYASESSTLQPVWPLLIGGLFVLVVLFLPRGIAGLVESGADRVLARLGSSSRRSDLRDSPSGQGIGLGKTTVSGGNDKAA
jgi:urea transport system permease protein